MRVTFAGAVMLCLLGAGVTAPSRAQDRGTVELSRSAIQTRRQEIVTRLMSLDEGQSQAFFPVYREYRGEMEKVNDQLVKLLADYDRDRREISDAQALEMVKSYMKYEQARLDVQRKYLGRFQKVLPAKKVARFFQVENKLDAVVNYELAGNVPIID